MKKYIFDLDGTLALIDHRSHHVRDGNRNWKQFFEECDKDLPNTEVIRIFKNLVGNGYHVEIWSGRSDIVREKTERWLDRHLSVHVSGEGVYVGSSFLKRMRPNGDNQKDSLLKKSWLDDERAKGTEIIAVFDDRQQVVDMWRKEGITCFQVAPGDFDNKPTSGKIINRTPTLVMMVGPSGAGKSTWIKENKIPVSAVVSTDAIREELWGDRNSPEAFVPENFSKPHNIANRLVRQRLEMGLDVIHEASNIKPADRKRLHKYLEGLDYHCTYVIVDRPLDEKLETMDQQNSTIVRKHHETFNQNVNSALSGDGIAFVAVDDTRNFK